MSHRPQSLSGRLRVRLGRRRIQTGPRRSGHEPTFLLEVEPPTRFQGGANRREISVCGDRSRSSTPPTVAEGVVPVGLATFDGVRGR